jgi:hypothetical protein
MTGSGDAPGLNTTTKPKSGRTYFYWRASAAGRKAGFKPVQVRLNYPSKDHPDLIHRCRVLQAEMLEFLSGRKPNPADARFQRGTIGWFCERFETDEDSPIHGKRADTQRFYALHLATIRKQIGKVTVAGVIGQDIRRWFKNWRAQAANPERGHDGLRTARARLQTLARVIGYGAGDLSDTACQKLRATMEAMEFETTKPRSVAATHAQVQAFHAAAAEAGRPNMALAVLMMFEFTWRQRDVIGEWVTTPKGEPRTGIVAGKKRWENGLTWDQIGPDWVIAKPLSKANGSKVSRRDLRKYPDLLAALQAVPLAKRIGPVIRDDDGSGLPYRADHFRHVFRSIATKAGWPMALRCMDTRAGAITEADSAGAAVDDIRGMANHSQVATTLGYIRSTDAAEDRVVELRRKARTKDSN